MDKNEEAYIRLQQHLDRQAVGFPATRSGAEIKILKHIFTPREAEIAATLSYKPEPLERIFERARHMVESPEELASLLDCIQRKGGIESSIKDGERRYCCAPLVVGMYELQIGRLTPEFIQDFEEYISSRKFGIEFLSTELPQMRTIPISRSIRPEHRISSFDEVTTLLQQAEGPFVIFECICRKKSEMEGKPCKVTDRKETCLALGDVAQSILLGGVGKEIGKEEVLSIIEQNQKDGLLLQPSNTEKVEFICSCCGCCCGMLRVHRSLPKPLDFWASNFQAVVDASACDGCGVCVKRCQVRAVSVSGKKAPAVVNLNRCIGCGLCVPTCPKNAISIHKKAVEIRPPQTKDELYDIIMARKKGKLGKLKLTGKLIVDAVRTGRTDLL
jgi:NAD-dependent dihydropyrimidine dehydrogenase PreA subunit